MQEKEVKELIKRTCDLLYTLESALEINEEFENAVIIKILRKELPNQLELINKIYRGSME